MTVARTIRAVGRRKEASAQIRIKAGTGSITVNGKKMEEFFPYFEYQAQIREPLAAAGRADIDVTVVVRGGGVRGQAEAIRLGIARALVVQDVATKPVLRASHLLTRDPRVKERKKYGLKRARRAPQWQKR